MSTQVTAKNFRTLPKGRYSLGDGLILFVTSETSRSWVVRYSFNGKRVDFSLGSANHMSITTAKTKAAQVIADVRNGIDPKEKRKAAREECNTVRFAEFARHAIEEIREVRRWKNEKHAQDWLSTIETYAIPVIGTFPIDKITRLDILEILRPIWTTKSETADRLRGRLESIFSLAIAKNLITTNPAAWKDGLSFFLPPISKIHEVKHHEAMPLNELTDFAPLLRERGNVSHLAILFGILTAARAQEFLGARWDEIDTISATWTIPPERMKCKIEHRVPLSKQALSILSGLPRTHELVFPAPRSRGRMSIDTPRQMLRKITSTTYTMHGFRSTFRDWCEENFIHEALAERSLAHVKGDKVVQAYQRSDLLEQRREVMQRWADEILPNIEA